MFGYRLQAHHICAQCRIEHSHTRASIQDTILALDDPLRYFATEIHLSERRTIRQHPFVSWCFTFTFTKHALELKGGEDSFIEVLVNIARTKTQLEVLDNKVACRENQPGPQLPDTKEELHETNNLSEQHALILFSVNRR